MTTRITAAGVWVSQSALHCGGSAHDEDSGTDMPLLRNQEGKPFIPAASLIGAARSYVGRFFMPSTQYELSDQDDREPYSEPLALLNVFGSRGLYASLLSGTDAQLEQNLLATLRDGVRIDSRTGLAYATDEGGAKFDSEVLPAGARFPLSFELRLPSPLPPNATEGDLLAVLGVVLRGFQSGEIRLGAKTTRGYGAGAVQNWSIRRVDKSHFVQWLKRDSTAGEPLTVEDLLGDSSLPDTDHRRRFEIEASFFVKTSVLVRSGGSESKDPDSVHLTESDKSVLPGTSVAGVLRHRCERIANTICKKDATVLVSGMFGPARKEGEREALRASRVRVDEAPLADGGAHVHTRVAIDRFTQASRETALFTEAPFWPGKSTDGHIRSLRIVLQPPRHNEKLKRNENEVPLYQLEAALLLMAFKDLWTGYLTVGGGAAAGRGALAGRRAIFCHPDLGTLTMESVPGGLASVACSGPQAGWLELERWCSSLASEVAA